MENRDKLARLTDREKVCLRQWLQHKSAKEIAAEIGISHHAVEKRLKMARTKLGVASSLEAARILREDEGYDRTVAHTPDLATRNPNIQTVFTQPLIFGAIAMSLIGMAVLALFMQPQEEGVALAESAQLPLVHDEQLNAVLTTLIASAVIDSDGGVLLTYPLGDPLFMEPNSGSYWQISGEGHEDFSSRSLWGRKLMVSRKAWPKPLHYDSDQFPDEPLRMVERTVNLPGSDVEWQFVVARSH